MSKKCCIPNCRLQKDDPGCRKLSFFLVPSDEKSRIAWANSIKNYFKQDVVFKKYTYVCALHFEQTFLTYGFGLGKIIRLKKTACPTVFENYESRHKNESMEQDVEVQCPLVKSNQGKITNQSPLVILKQEENSDESGETLLTSPLVILRQKEKSDDCDENLVPNSLVILKQEENSDESDETLVPSQNKNSVSMSKNSSSFSIAAKQDSQLARHNSESLLDDNADNTLDNNQMSNVYDHSITPKQLLEISEIKRSNENMANDELNYFEQNLLKKSLANINLDYIDYKNEHLVRKVFEKAQLDIRTLRRSRRSQAMRLYRAKKRVQKLVS